MTLEAELPSVAPVGNRRLTTTLLASQVSLASGALAVNVLSARYLGPSARGQLALYLQICYSANLIALLGRNRSYLATSTIVSRLSVSLREMSLLTRLPLMIATGLAICFGSILGGSLLASIALIAALWVMLASGLLVNNQRTAAIVARRAAPYLWSTIAAQILMVCAALLLVALGSDAVNGWLIAYGVSSIIPFVVTELIVRHGDGSPARSIADLAPTKRLGVRLLPAGISDAVLTRADRLLLPLLSSFHQLGIYAVVSTVTELINWPLKQYIDGKTPNWTCQVAAGTLRPWQTLRATALYSAAVAGAVGITTYMILIPVFGEAYRDGLRLIFPLAAASALYSLSALGVALATSAHRARLAGFVSSSGMVVGISLYIILIPPFGALGAALASLAGYGVSAAVGVAAVSSVARTMKTVPQCP